jgi:hypothetical protein
LRTFIYSSTGRFLIRLVFVTVAVVCVTSCDSGEEEPVEHVFTTDELYLIDSYMKVRRAGAHYPSRPLLADSLLTDLAAEMDSARIEHTVATVNLTPERWIPLFEEIERLLRESAEESAEVNEEQLEKGRS